MNNFSSPGKGEKACFSTDISHTQPTNLLRIPDVDLGIKRGALVSLLYQQSRTCDSPGPPHAQNLPSTSRAVPSAPLRGPPCSATALPSSVRARGAERLPESQGYPASSSKAGSRTNCPFPPGELATESHICRISPGPGEKEPGRWSRLCQVPATLPRY